MLTSPALQIYLSYQEQLKAADAVDFDDLLLKGVDLFKAQPSVLSNVRHVLVDEFQDTNTTQYRLLR